MNIKVNLNVLYFMILSITADTMTAPVTAEPQLNVLHNSFFFLVPVWT